MIGLTLRIVQFASKMWDLLENDCTDSQNNEKTVRLVFWSSDLNHDSFHHSCSGYRQICEMNSRVMLSCSIDIICKIVLMGLRTENRESKNENRTETCQAASSMTISLCRLDSAMNIVFSSSCNRKDIVKLRFERFSENPPNEFEYYSWVLQIEWNWIKVNDEINMLSVLVEKHSANHKSDCCQRLLEPHFLFKIADQWPSRANNAIETKDILRIKLRTIDNFTISLPMFLFPYIGPKNQKLNQIDEFRHISFFPQSINVW
jgi:hypothetical protein